MTVLGIETSCDETSASVLGDGGEVLSSVIYSQLEHARYGGVVPELASRAHIRKIVPVVREALRQAETAIPEVDGIAVTRGPGLVGALLVGLSFTKALALAIERPFVAVNHLEGHLFSVTIERDDIAPPFLALIVSGGHTELVLVSAFGDYRVLGRTRDDAAGEAFDKVAKILRLFEDSGSAMGGPRIARLAQTGDPASIAFPRGMMSDGLDFSFSGLKTAVANHLSGLSQVELDRDKANISASFQAAVVDVLVTKTIRAAQACSVRTVALVGGVAASSELRRQMTRRAEGRSISVVWPPSSLCTDNAAMIAAAGRFRLARGERSLLCVDAVSRWRLEDIPRV